MRSKLSAMAPQVNGVATTGRARGPYCRFGLPPTVGISLQDLRWGNLRHIYPLGYNDPP